MIEMIITCDNCGKQQTLEPEPWIGQIDIDLEEHNGWIGYMSQIYCCKDCYERGTKTPYEIEQ